MTNIRSKSLSHLEIRKAYRADILKNVVSFIGLFLLLILFFFVSEGRSLSSRNIKTIINQFFMVFIVATGSSFVFAQGNIDLSLGGVVGICIYVTAMCSTYIHPIIALFFALFLGTILGLINGICHTKLGIPAFLMTLAMQFTLRGLIGAFTAKLPSAVKLPQSMKWIDERFFKLFIVVVIFVIFYFLFEYTKLGKESRAIGSNSQAAYNSGVNVDRMKIIAFCCAGLMAGLAGFFGFARSGSVSAQSGTFIEMDNIIALVLGGMSLNGGSKSRIQCALIGSLMLVVLSNGLVLWGLDENLQQGIKGLILICAVALSYQREPGQIIR